jgi:hypothetical protein
MGVNITSDNAGQSESLAEGGSVNAGCRRECKQNTKEIGHGSKKRRTAAAQAVPELFDFVVGSFLADLAIALKTHNQAHPIGKLLEVLVKGHTFGGPVSTAVMTETLKR